MGIIVAVVDDSTDNIVVGLVAPVLPSGSTSLPLFSVVVVFRSTVDDDSANEASLLDDDFIFFLADRSSARLAQYNIFSACKRILS
jgi:hypothetical protein